MPVCVVFYPDKRLLGRVQHFCDRVRAVRRGATITGPIVGVIISYGIYNLIGFTHPHISS